MANTFYDPGEQRAAKVNELFATVATRYDLMNDWQSFGLHRVWKRHVVRLAAVRSGDRALDVCCGTGDLALALAGQGARVTGLDFNSPMLEVARQKLIARIARNPKSPIDNQNPEFIQSDAQNIPFADGSFELVTIGYGLRNLADWERGLREMQRVLKPGGRLLILDFGKPDNAIWRGIYFGYLRLFVPLLGRIFCGNAAAYAYILESLQTYPAQAGVAAKLRELNFAEVRVINLLGGVMSIHYAEKA
jgi:demethylmenaquinone methyltransferase/2-methoxy-6-polyprenyl-1,4-benzoquinol methylase